MVSYVGVPPEKNNSVAGIINFMRNMGSSVGTSLVSTMIARRSQYHQQILVDYVREGSSNLRNTVTGLSAQLNHGGLGTHEAQGQAYARIYGAVQTQAATLAYMDTFMLLAVLGSIMFLLSFILKKNEPGGGRVIAE